MKKYIKNKAGMTLIEVLLAVVILVLMIWTFAPFVASTFKQIAQAGHLHIELSTDVSTIDNQLADEYFGAPVIFPVSINGDASVNVDGFLLTSGKLNTFYSEVSSYISTDDILYEGYGSDGFYNNFYSIGFLPDITDKKFFKNDHTYVVTLTGADGFLYLVDEEFTVLTGDPKFDIDPASVIDGASVFICASQFPDNVGGNPDKIGYILILPDTLGLDNSNSPYELMIMTKDTGQHFVEEPIVIHVMLPLYQAVGNDGFERIASELNYWVDKYSQTVSTYGNGAPSEPDFDTPLIINRLPDSVRDNGDVTFYDVLWHDADYDTTLKTAPRYYTVGENANLYYRQDQVPWIPIDVSAYTTDDLNRIKYIGNKFVIVGDGGTVLISDNGIEWEDKSISVPDNITGLAYGDNKYIAVGETGTIYYTIDGFSNWETYGISQAWPDEESILNINDVVWCGTGFIAVGDDSLIAFSVDGLNWQILDSTVKVPNAFGNLYSVLVNRGLGIIVGENGQIHRFSMDVSGIEGWTWTTVRSPNSSQEDLYDVTYSRRAFVTVGEDGKVMNSLNGATWTDCGTMEGFDNFEKSGTDAHEIYAVAGRE